MIVYVNQAADGLVIPQNIYQKYINKRNLLTLSSIAKRFSLTIDTLS